MSDRLQEISNRVARAFRFKARLPALMLFEGDEHPCTAHDLSRSGVLLTGDLPIPDEPDLEVTIRSPTGDLELKAIGRVSRVVEQGPEGTAVALEFMDLAEPDRQILESLLGRVIEFIVPAVLGSLPPGATQEQIRQALQEIPIAHRITLASRGSFKERELLLADPQPPILDALARNPQLNSGELRMLLRQRNLPPRALQALAQMPKWTSQEELRLLIAGHPETPIGVAERLAASLTPLALQKLIRHPGVNPELRLKLGAKTRRTPR